MADGETFDLRSTYVQLHDGGRAETTPVTDDFWPEVIAGRRTLGDRLAMVGHMAADWDTWEMHPGGEELLVLLSGAVDVIVAEGGAERRIAMRPGDAFLMPSGAWHRAEVREPGDMLFVTWGAGTEHKPL